MVFHKPFGVAPGKILGLKPGNIRYGPVVARLDGKGRVLCHNGPPLPPGDLIFANKIQEGPQAVLGRSGAGRVRLEPFRQRIAPAGGDVGQLKGRVDGGRVAPFRPGRVGRCGRVGLRRDAKRLLHVIQITSCGHAYRAQRHGQPTGHGQRDVAGRRPGVGNPFQAGQIAFTGQLQGQARPGQGKKQAQGSQQNGQGGGTGGIRRHGARPPQAAA